jgi:hypothetical protein
MALSFDGQSKRHADHYHFIDVSIKYSYAHIPRAGYVTPGGMGFDDVDFS